MSADASLPSLAGQDPQYLIKAIKAYRSTRQHWGMQRIVAGLSDKDMENITAFYTAQKNPRLREPYLLPPRIWPKNAIAATTQKITQPWRLPGCAGRTGTI